MTDHLQSRVLALAFTEKWTESVSTPGQDPFGPDAPRSITLRSQNGKKITMWRPLPENPTADFKVNTGTDSPEKFGNHKKDSVTVRYIGETAVNILTVEFSGKKPIVEGHHLEERIGVAPTISPEEILQAVVSAELIAINEQDQQLAAQL